MLHKLMNLLREEDDPEGTIDPKNAAAALMFEIVWADHDVSEQELRTMSSALVDLFAIAPNHVERLIEEARTQHDASVGLYEFTRILNDHMSAEAKQQVIVALWQIAYADAHIDRFEEHMIRRVAELLYVPHKEFINAKHQARSTSSSDI